MGRKTTEIRESMQDEKNPELWRKLMLHYANRREKYNDKYNNIQKNIDHPDAKSQLSIAKNKLKIINKRIKDVTAGAKSNGITRSKIGYTKLSKN